MKWLFIKTGIMPDGHELELWNESFDSFRDANCAMQDDVEAEYEEEMCDEDDEDGFYSSQKRPSSKNKCAKLSFRDGNTMVWRLQIDDE